MQSPFFITSSLGKQYICLSSREEEGVDELMCRKNRNQIHIGPVKLLFIFLFRKKTMFNTSADMDVASPSPKRQTSLEQTKPKTRTLPPFLLGDSAQSKPLFNNTPLKSRNSDSNSRIPTNGLSLFGRQQSDLLSSDTNKENHGLSMGHGQGHGTDINSLSNRNGGVGGRNSNLDKQTQSLNFLPQKTGTKPAAKTNSFIPTASLGSMNHYSDPKIGSNKSSNHRSNAFGGASRNVQNNFNNSLLTSDSFNNSNINGMTNIDPVNLVTNDGPGHLKNNHLSNLNKNSNKVFASSPLPDKDRPTLQSQTTPNVPGMKPNGEIGISPIYPGGKANEGSTPLARQMFERRMKNGERKGLDESATIGVGEFNFLIKKTKIKFSRDKKLPKLQ